MIVTCDQIRDAGGRALSQVIMIRVSLPQNNEQWLLIKSVTIFLIGSNQLCNAFLK